MRRVTPTRRNGSISFMLFGHATRRSIGTGFFFKLKNVLGDPRPGAPLPIINAAGSDQGREFAVRNASFLVHAGDRSVAFVGRNRCVEAAGKAGRPRCRRADILPRCLPSDRGGSEMLSGAFRQDACGLGRRSTTWCDLQFAHAQSFPHDLLALIRDRMAAGHGGFPLTGTPEQVADGITSLHAAASAARRLSFVDYVEEFPYFRDNVPSAAGAAGHPDCESGVSRRCLMSAQ